MRGTAPQSGARCLPKGHCMSPGLSPGVGTPAQPQGSWGPMGSSSPTTASHCRDAGGEGEREPMANKGPKPLTPTSCCSPPGCCLLNPPHPAPLGDISHIRVPDSGQELLRATSPTMGQAKTKPLSWKANIIPCSCERVWQSCPVQPGLYWSTDVSWCPCPTSDSPAALCSLLQFAFLYSVLWGFGTVK